MPFPIDFITRTKALLGDEYSQLEAALIADTPVSVRINRAKGTQAPKDGEPVGWCDTGYYLPRRPAFTFDPLFHAGAYYVQEASSMFLEQAIRTYVTTPVRCLDLCAAPGGKSTHLSSLLPDGSLLVSNEVIRNRSYILAENLAKWGNASTIVLNNDPAEIGEALPEQFDLIVTDVPCSGEGMFRKDEASVGEWSVENVQLCAARQRRILHDIWPALRPGGLLVYSTCTFNAEEDEENVRHIVEELGAEALPIATDEAWRVTGPLRYENPVYRFFPHKTKGEGFFLAILRKSGDEEYEVVGERPTKSPKNKGKKDKKATLPIPQEAWDYFREKENITLEWDGPQLRMIPTAHKPFFDRIRDKRLRILSAGVVVGESKGKDLIPSQALALSQELNPSAFPDAELTWEEAIRYLRKEAITLPEGLPKGYLLMRYQGIPLGFVKHLGNRSNNLYPQEWRIRSGYLPDEPAGL